MDGPKLTWSINFLKGKLLFFEKDKEVGHVNLKDLFGSSYYFRFNNSTYVIHPELLAKNRIRIYNHSNDRQLAVIKLKLWNSEAVAEYQRRTFTLKSSFLGIGGNTWSSSVEAIELKFHNRLTHGEIAGVVSEKELFHILVIGGIQSMFIYSLLLLISICVVLYIIL